MHYFNGKPAAADYNGGASVIHSNKSYTEWSDIVSHKRRLCYLFNSSNHFCGFMDLGVIQLKGP